MKAITGIPIKFIGTGEKTDDFEFFHPDLYRIKNLRNGRCGISRRESTGND